MSKAIERIIKLVDGPNNGQEIEEDYLQIKYVKVKGDHRGTYARIVGGEMNTFYWFKDGIPRQFSYKGTVKVIEPLELETRNTFY